MPVERAGSARTTLPHLVASKRLVTELLVHSLRHFRGLEGGRFAAALACLAQCVPHEFAPDSAVTGLGRSRDEPEVAVAVVLSSYERTGGRVVVTCNVQ